MREKNHLFIIAVKVVKPLGNSRQKKVIRNKDGGK